ncbi:F-box associated domain [Theobroma cacao]|nr:F-box associated domain [Theobroma cacao]
MSRFKLLTHDTLEVSLDLGLPFPRWDTVVGSCNGLVCLYIDHHFPRTKIMLYNPALRVHKIIPESTLPGPESRSVGHVFLGFGYDSVNNDYKVVRVVSLNCHKEGKLVSSVKAEVYTLGVNSWREVAIPPGVNFGLYKPQVFLNGAIHWLGMVEKNRNAIKVLVSFDVSTEVFNLIPLPVFAQREIWPMWIDVYKNSLCVVKTAEGPCYEIWVMKEFGVQEIPFPWWDNVVGSYNGLVCFCDIDHLLMRTKILLYSPALRVHKIIPESPFSRPKNGCFGPVSLGFGYDSINNVYKVAMIVSMHYGEEGILHAFLNGAIHWLGFLGKKRNAKQVVSFDVSTEAFKLFLLPDFVLKNRYLRWIDVHKNFLCD